MGNAFVVLFYLWLAVSVVVLVSRFARRRRRPTIVTGPSPTGPRPPPVPGPDPLGSPPPPGPPPSPPPVPAPPSSAPAARLGSAGVPGRGRSTSLMEALTGIALPCDLMPLTAAQGRELGNRELMLITSGHDASEVSRSLQDAMAALGYTATSMANHDFVAARDGDRIAVSLHDRPEGMLAGAKPAFPTAKPGDVVVELHL